MGCLVTKTNLGVTKCTLLPQLIKGMIETPVGFKFTAANAISSTFWQAAILAASGVRVYKWAQFVGFRDISEAPVYEENALASLKVRDGRYQFEADIKQDLCYHRAMYSHRANNGRLVFIDLENNILATKLDATNYAGMNILQLDTHKLKISDGQVSTKSPIRIVLADNREIDKSGELFDGSSWVNSVLPLSDVTITQITGTTTKIVVSVTVTCDGTPVNGLVAADFVVLKADGTSQTVSTVTEVNGVYTINITGTAVTGTVNLISAATLSVPGYEAAATIVTVPFP